MKIEKVEIDRLALSCRLLEAWEAMGMPLGTPAELLRMIENEIAILAKLRDQAPAQVDDLVTRYRVLADQCRLGVN
ncbi:MAG: hypothetical protein ACTHLT_20590 [Devosia sp.]